MDLNERILGEADKLEQYVINARRLIHTYAEVGGEEVKTSAFVKAELEAEGIPYIGVADTAVIGIFDTGKPGPGIALRADMDALPMPENPYNLKGPRCCVSENKNTCHACGHDAHTAMLLGSMKALCALKDAICGTIYFCFEEGEECGKSGAQMVEALSNYKVDTVWAIHVNNVLESGKIAVDPGPRMAGAGGVSMVVRGRGGHGSRPDQSINPVYAAAAIVANIPGAFVNQLNPEKAVTFGITTIQGGGITNIFPDTAEIKGSLRFFYSDEGAKALEIVKSVAEHTAAMNRCTVEFDPGMVVVVEPVVNDDRCAALAQKALAEVLPEGSVAHFEKLYGSESYSRYVSAYPGVLANLGINNPVIGTGAAHHNEYFDVDESALKIGVISTVKYAVTSMDC